MTSTKDADRAMDVELTIDQDQIEGMAVVARSLGGDRDVIAVTVSGYLDSTTTHVFQRMTARLIDAGHVSLIVDLRGTGFMASVGIGAMVGLLKTIRAKGGSLILMGIQARVLEVFQLLGFATFFDLAGSVEEAMETINARPPVRTFPTTAGCPICGKAVRLTRPGRFRCPQCRIILTVGETAEITL